MIISICSKLAGRGSGALLRGPIAKFSKQSQPPRNENYINSRKVVPRKPVKQEFQQKLTEMLNRDQHLNIKFLVMGNVLLMGAIPFWEPINAAITLLNGGLILNHAGHQFKRYLLLVNNHHTDQLTTFRTPEQYLRILGLNFGMLSMQSVFLGLGYFGASHLFTMVWLATSIRHGVIPPQYLIMLLPLAAIGLMYLLGDWIRETLLSGKSIPISLSSTGEPDKK